MAPRRPRQGVRPAVAGDPVSIGHLYPLNATGSLSTPDRRLSTGSSWRFSIEAIRRVGPAIVQQSDLAPIDTIPKKNCSGGKAMQSRHDDSFWESQGAADRRRKARAVVAVSALLVVVAAQAAFGQPVVRPLPDGASPAITMQNDARASEASHTSRLTSFDLDPQADEGGSRCAQADPALADVFTCYSVQNPVTMPEAAHLSARHPPSSLPHYHPTHLER